MRARDLAVILEKHVGELKRIDIPFHQGATPFAFVEFRNRNNAREAIRILNGYAIGRNYYLQIMYAKDKTGNNSNNSNNSHNNNNHHHRNNNPVHRQYDHTPARGRQIPQQYEDRRPITQQNYVEEHKVQPQQQQRNVPITPRTPSPSLRSPSASVSRSRSRSMSSRSSRSSRSCSSRGSLEEGEMREEANEKMSENGEACTVADREDTPHADEQMEVDEPVVAQNELFVDSELDLDLDFDDDLVFLESDEEAQN